MYALIKTCSIICNMQLNVLNDLAEAMKALDGKKCWEFRLFSQDNASSLTTCLRPCIVLFLFGMRCGFFGVTMFSNQVGRTDLTPVALAEFVFLIAGCDIWRNHPCGDEYGDELDVPCYLQDFGLEVGCDASDLSIYNSCV